MRVKDIAFVAIRLLALYLTVEAVAVLPSSIAMILLPNVDSSDMTMNGTLAMGGLISGLALVLFGGLLWSFANSLADFMTKSLREESDFKEEVKLQNMKLVGITVIGVFVIASSAPGFINAMVILTKMNSLERVDTLNALGPIVQMVIGFMCAFKSRYVVSRLQGDSKLVDYDERAD